MLLPCYCRETRVVLNYLTHHHPHDHQLSCLETPHGHYHIAARVGAAQTQFIIGAVVLSYVRSSQVPAEASRRTRVYHRRAFVRMARHVPDAQVVDGTDFILCCNSYFSTRANKHSSASLVYFDCSSTSIATDRSKWVRSALKCARLLAHPR